jgi:hypothetical protein
MEREHGYRRMGLSLGQPGSWISQAAQIKRHLITHFPEHSCHLPILNSSVLSASLTDGPNPAFLALSLHDDSDDCVLKIKTPTPC